MSGNQSSSAHPGIGAAEPTPEALDRDIKNIRHRLDRLVGELDRRRHNMTDPRYLWSHYKGFVLGAAAVVAAGSSLIISYKHLRRRSLQHRLFAGRRGD